MATPWVYLTDEATGYSYYANTCAAAQGQWPTTPHQLQSNTRCVRARLGPNLRVITRPCEPHIPSAAPIHPYQKALRREGLHPP